jgi:hypothetical protein
METHEADETDGDHDETDSRKPEDQLRQSLEILKP